MLNICRTEYPRPQFKRDSYICLNGEWDFEIDYGQSGEERGFYKNEKSLLNTINIPFCPESKLSGIQNVDFMPCVWYKKIIEIKKTNHRIILHFGGVDYNCKLYVNEELVGNHIGCCSFSFDITDYICDGKNVLCLVAYDDCRSKKQTNGKQSCTYYSKICDYTRTTGIWQTVWIEEVEPEYIKFSKVTSDAHTGDVQFEVETVGSGQIETIISLKGKVVGDIKVNAHNGINHYSIRIDNPILWEVGNSTLYDLKYIFNNDKVESYFAFRDVRMGDNAVLINDKPVFQRLVLDQGYYRNGIWTAPSDADLKNDIIMQMQLGFNGARLHQKVFEERYLYWADKLGYLVWGEFPSWGLDISDMGNAHSFIMQWLDVVKRDYNHPSIVTWCPFNETWDYNSKPADKRVLELVYTATKAYDAKRPVIDTSGNYHSNFTDIYDIHDYEQNTEIFTKRWQSLKNSEVYDSLSDRQKYNGQLVMVSEFGGTWWAPNSQNGWGYGDAPKSQEEFANRYYGLTTALLGAQRICGFCYTQTTDVEQEQNGLFDYDRQKKFDEFVYDTIKKANNTIAQIEK